MTEHDDLLYIEHILDSISKIQKSIDSLSKESFINNEDLVDATIRRLEVIGEAVRNISEDTKNKHKEVEWKEIVGTRDKMIHHYFGIDLNIIWKIIKEDISNLNKKIIKIKQTLIKNSKNDKTI